MTVTEPRGTKAQREARLQWVPISAMRVSALAQRDLQPSRVDKIAADMDFEQLGNPTVNERDGVFYLIDGRHRVWALKKIGWGDQQIQCWTYKGLTEEEEAEKFLKLNDVLIVSAFAKFKVAVQAGRTDETEINRLVLAQGLRVSRDKQDGSISAVGTLRRVHARAGSVVLGKALRIVRDSFGSAGLDSAIIDGVSLFVERYPNVDEDEVVKRLGALKGGANGLRGKAQVLRSATGNAVALCVAAAVVDVINVSRKGGRIPSWWTA